MPLDNMSTIETKKSISDLSLLKGEYSLGKQELLKKDPEFFKDVLVTGKKPQENSNLKFSLLDNKIFDTLLSSKNIDSKLNKLEARIC